MPLIKSTAAPASPSPFSMKDIEQQAKAILARAREQAEALLAAAQTEAEQLKKIARQAGLTEGRTQGLAQGRQEGTRAGHEQALAEQREALASAMNALTAAAGQINASRRDLQAAALKDVLQLAIDIAHAVTKRLGTLDPAVAVANVEEALKLVVHASDVHIAIHPAQKAALDDALPRIRLQWPALEHVEIVQDPSLSPGGCRIYTAHGHVDGDLPTQLSRIVADLLPESQETLE